MDAMTYSNHLSSMMPLPGDPLTALEMENYNNQRRDSKEEEELKSFQKLTLIDSVHSVE
jgi:hypothetical protein